MSPDTMNYIYFATIGIVGLVMYSSPNSFLGKAKYDESAVKAEAVVKKAGIAIIVMAVLLTLYFLFIR